MWWTRGIQQAGAQIAAVNTVLAEIGAAGKPTIMVFNKIDRLEESNGLLAKLLEQYPNSVGLSAKTGEGLAGLIQELGTQLRPSREFW